VLSIPLVLWVWRQLGSSSKVITPRFLLPLAVFIGVTLLTAAAWFALEDWPRQAALIVIAVGVVLAQLRYNATRPPGSMFESNGSVPFFLALLPVAVGALAAQIIMRARPGRRYIMMGWELGSLAWITALVGWSVKFMGFYNYQNSYAFSLGSLFELRYARLVALGWAVLPRRPARDRQTRATSPT